MLYSDFHIVIYGNYFFNWSPSISKRFQSGVCLVGGTMNSFVKRWSIILNATLYLVLSLKFGSTMWINPLGNKRSVPDMGLSVAKSATLELRGKLCNDWSFLSVKRISPSPPSA